MGHATAAVFRLQTTAPSERSVTDGLNWAGRLFARLHFWFAGYDASTNKFSAAGRSSGQLSDGLSPCITRLGTVVCALHAPCCYFSCLSRQGLRRGGAISLPLASRHAHGFGPRYPPLLYCRSIMARLSRKTRVSNKRFRGMAIETSMLRCGIAQFYHRL